MLKFFRKIRQKLIDQGDAKRYLLYAIGEILLVVVGILIALQINNWNTNQTNRHTETEYLHRLKNELKQDLDAYKWRQQLFMEKEESLKRIVRIW